MLDNTYIIFTSDHGLSVGQHGLIGKQSLYDHSIRVPMIISGPGIKKNRVVSHDIYLQERLLCHGQAHLGHGCYLAIFLREPSSKLLITC
mgnify:CR=1 FL=1